MGEAVLELHGLQMGYIHALPLLWAADAAESLQTVQPDVRLPHKRLRITSGGTGVETHVAGPSKNQIMDDVP